MNKIICYSYIRLFGLLCCLYTLVLTGCSKDEDYGKTGTQTAQKVSIPIEINSSQLSLLRSIEEQPYTIDRALILSYKKTDESMTNDDINFELDISLLAAAQVNLDGLVTHKAMLEFISGSTYKVLVLGFNQNDGGIESATPKFNIGGAGNSTFATEEILLQKSPADVPELFTGVCQSYITYNEISPTGEYFKPEEITILKATITRLVSGLNLEITNIPDSISSISLVAETLVERIHPISYVASSAYRWSPDNDNDDKTTFSTQVPVNGSVSFNHFLFPTFDTNKTKLYLDVQSTNQTKRFLVKVNDVPGVSSDNSIIFTPNDVVKISGDYSKIDFGFIIELATINLDDNDWDGLE